MFGLDLTTGTNHMFLVGKDNNLYYLETSN